MKERPILFSGAMVRAILEGRKTVTRRVVQPQPGDLFRSFGELQDDQKHGYGFHDGERFWRSPYGKPGDRLWVREAFLPDPDADHWSWDNHDCSYYEWNGCGSKIAYVPKAMQKPEHCIYREGWDGHELAWRPSIHMPRWASRILLEITDVCVERLQDISEQQALAEGVRSCEHELDPHGNDYSPYELFSALWVSINGHDSWHANPWVWVVEFKQVKP